MAAAHSSPSASPSGSCNRSRCVANPRARSPYTFQRTATNGTSTRIPRAKRAGGWCKPASRERGTRPGAAGANGQTLTPAGVTPVISVLERRASGLWRSGSASHWQCGGRGFESRQLHAAKPRTRCPQLGWYHGGLSSPGMEGLIYFLKGGRMTSELEKRIDRYTPAAIEAKWRERWASSGLHNTPDVSDKPNFYFLTMFPY